MNWENKKVAICYRGHYFRNNPPKNSNFFSCQENHHNFLYQYLGDYDIFFHTYPVDTESDSRLVDLVNPTNYVFENMQPGTPVINSICKVCELVSGYDFIINLRFDLLFLKSFDHFNVDDEKFNFLWKERKDFWEADRWTSDLMYAFNGNFLESFKSSLEPASTDYYNTRKYPHSSSSAHFVYKYLGVDESSINFMVDGHHPSGTEQKANGFIEINRSL